MQECTSREVLPESYRSMERSDVAERITELRRLLVPDTPLEECPTGASDEGQTRFFN